MRYKNKCGLVPTRLEAVVWRNRIGKVGGGGLYYIDVLYKKEAVVLFQYSLFQEKPGLRSHTVTT
jgi:hypothetical protein